MKLSNNFYYLLSGVKITLKTPKIPWKIFNLKATGHWPNCRESCQKKGEFDPWIFFFFETFPYDKSIKHNFEFLVR